MKTKLVVIGSLNMDLIVRAHAALATTRLGAQPSLPSRIEVEILLDKRDCQKQT
jgi:hypothetical protein